MKEAKNFRFTDDLEFFEKNLTRDLQRTLKFCRNCVFLFEYNVKNFARR